MWGGYGSHFVCVFVCYHATAIPHLYIENEGSLCHFPDLLRVAFTKNAMLKGFGVICSPSLPPSLLDKHSMDKEIAVAFFQRKE